MHTRVKGRPPIADSRSPLSAGERAPDFVLHTTPDQTISLGQFRGRPVVLAFYPSDWAPVCGAQLTLHRETLPEIHRLGAELIGISVDGVWSHLAFARALRIEFPLASDFEPKGSVARACSVYRAGDGVSERAIFVVDAGGIIRWSCTVPPAINPGTDGLTALEKMQVRGVAP